MSDYARTVSGPVPVEELGLVLPSERLLFDDRGGLPPEADLETTVQLATFAEVLRSPCRFADNLVVDRPSTVLDEWGHFAAAGGGCVVDLTPSAARLPIVKDELVAALSALPSHHLVQGYDGGAGAVPGPEGGRSLLRALDAALADDLPFGIVGKLCIEPGDDTVLRTIPSVQSLTGMAVVVQLPATPRATMQAADVVEEAGADLSRVVLGGMQRLRPDHGIHIQLARRGFTLLYDGFGHENLHESCCGVPEPRDHQVADLVAALATAGFGDRVLISTGSRYKISFAQYGGWGWAHIPHHVRRMIHGRGLSLPLIDQITRTNPHRLLGVRP